MLDLDAPVPATDVSVNLRWSVSSEKVADGDHANNTRFTTLWLCRPGSTRTGCPS